jgi:bla regulator protein BlaR1
MKKILVLSIFLCITTIVAQKNEVTPKNSKEKAIDDEVVEFNSIEIPPTFPGCENTLDKVKCFQDNLHQHIKNHFTYPKEAQDSNIQGKVFVKFIVEKNGAISIVNMKGPNPILEKEVKRILEQIPKLKPGIERGKPVRMSMSIPIDFKIKEEEAHLVKATDSPVEVQEYKEEDIIPFLMLETVPMFPGCENAIDKKTCFHEKLQFDIMKNFKYPKEAKDKGIQGKVFVSLIFEKNGSNTITKIRGPHPILEKEAKRIIGKLPKIKSGKLKGKPVRTSWSFPIDFRLKEEVKPVKMN